MKVKLPREVADAIESLKLSVGSRGILVGVLGSANTRQFEILKDYIAPEGGFKVLLEVLVNGYEVEETPEDKVREYYEQQLKANYNGTYDAPYHAIKHTLDLLNIKIKGVNDLWKHTQTYSITASKNMRKKIESSGTL